MSNAKQDESIVSLNETLLEELQLEELDPESLERARGGATPLSAGAALKRLDGSVLERLRYTGRENPVAFCIGNSCGKNDGSPTTSGLFTSPAFLGRVR